MHKPETEGRWNRRQFVASAVALAAHGMAHGQTAQKGTQNASGGREMFIVPHFHPASCGWLTNFSKERIYCANSYFSHLDRVRDDENYQFILSEVNNVIAMMNFMPQRTPELKQRIAEGRVELVNSFFLESTINLSGGEALVRMGVEGSRWYEKMFGVRPRYAWCIDTCGVHEQMAQIAHGLGLDAFIFTRRNPMEQVIFWQTSPDGTRILTICPGAYKEARRVFDSKTELTDAQLDKLEEQFAAKEEVTPDGAALLMLGSGEDYSVAPTVKQYPTEFLQQWKKTGHKRKVKFTTLSKYVDTILPDIKSDRIKLATHEGGTGYSYDAFWIENPTVKTRYRTNEQSLQAAEALATIASLKGHYEYPVQDLYEAWVLMFLNTDRNTLWGSAGGMVFMDKTSWDVQDRFEWVAKSARIVQGGAVQALGDGAGAMTLYNPLNWSRTDIITLELPHGKSVEGAVCEELPDGKVLCKLGLPSVSLSALKLTEQAPQKPVSTPAGEVITTSHYLLKLDPVTGAIVSLKMRKSGREMFGGPANVVLADRARLKTEETGDHVAPIPERERMASSNEGRSTIEVVKGPLATTILITGKFCGGDLRRTIRLYEGHARIDFETELNDIPNYTVVFTDFPLSEAIIETRRGVPFGFSHAAWSKPNPNLHGWAKGIVPAVRWSEYTLAGGGGMALFDRGLSGRELNGRTASLYLMNATDKYWGYENAWLSGKGKHVMHYALMPYETGWLEARIPQASWEYNMAPVVLEGHAGTQDLPYLETSGNVIVESLRREGDHIAVRLAESSGVAGAAHVKLLLPHKEAFVTDLAGKNAIPLPGGPEYHFKVRPQQIVTLHFHTTAGLPDMTPMTGWDKFVSEAKRPALHAYDPSLIGHPPFGS